MYVGIARITLRLAENHSLKGKRRVARSLKDRLRNQFGVAVAEVEDQEMWQTLTLGIACVSGNASIVDQVLQQVVDFAEHETRGDAELIDHEVEVLSSP